MVACLIVRAICDRVADSVVGGVVLPRTRERVVGQELQSTGEAFVHLHLQCVVAAAGVVAQVIAQIITAANHYRSRTGGVSAGSGESIVEGSPKCRGDIWDE